MIYEAVPLLENAFGYVDCTYKKLFNKQKSEKNA